jgi:hypothetical protein
MNEHRIRIRAVQTMKIREHRDFEGNWTIPKLG